MHPVTCSLPWVRCLFDRLAISDFGGKQMTPKVKTFENVFQDSLTGHRTTFRGQIWWKSAVAKLQKGRLDYHTKTMAPRDSSQPPFCHKWADRAQNSLNVVTPWPVHVHWIWSRSVALCRTYSGKIDFSAQKSQYNIGFERTMTLSTNDNQMQVDYCFQLRHRVDIIITWKKVSLSLFQLT